MKNNRIVVKLEHLKKNREKALICYITAGDPHMEVTKKMVAEMERSGADIIELGIPYSDPLADGPVIQRAAKRSLDGGTRLEGIFSAVEDLRKSTQIPLVFLLYFNSMLQYGEDRFLNRCVEAGVDGLIVADLPLEERGDLRHRMECLGLALIPLVAPTSQERIHKIVQDANGFVYCVSSLGVTGTRSTFSENLIPFMEQVKGETPLPRAIGFGISGPQAIRDLKEYAEAFIVGSAIIAEMEKGLEDGSHTARVGEFVRTLKEAMN